jgi:hypothetical protein
MAGKGWVKGMMRCGNYNYREVWTHTTNPDHLVPNTPSLTDIPPPRRWSRFKPSPWGQFRLSRRYRRDVAAGASQADVYKETIGWSGWDRESASFFIGAAQGTYCPT